MPNPVLSTLPVLSHLIFVRVIKGGCCYHICLSDKGIMSMKFMFTLCGPQPHANQGQEDSGSPALNHSPHHLLRPHRGPCQKSVKNASLVHFRWGPILSQRLGHIQLVSKCPLLLCWCKVPFSLQLIIAFSLQAALLDFSRASFRVQL